MNHAHTFRCRVTRRTTRSAAAVFAAVLFAPALPAPAAPAHASSPLTAAQVVARGKAATGLLVVPGEGGDDQASGTAFCVDPAGYFVTNQHVTEGAATGDYSLLMRPGEPDQKTYVAHVIRTDKEADLSLLKVDGAAGLAALPLGSDAALTETDPVTAYGYPFGKDLALNAKDAPSVSVSVGHITALRHDADGLKLIQVDASLNPGNSGGPVLDDGGRVIGVVEEGVPGASLNFAIPVRLLAKFLHTPAISLDPPALTPGWQTRAGAFRLSVIPFIPGGGPYAVTLTLSPPGQSPRTLTAEPAGSGAYTVTAAPAPRPAGPPQMLLTATYPGGQIAARVADREVTVGGQTLMLSGLRKVGPDSVETADGRTVAGRVNGLRAVSATVGGVPQTINFSSYGSVTVADADPAPASIPYEVTVRKGAEVIGRLAGSLPPAAAAVDAAQAPAPGAARDGLLIVAADCWPTSDTGFDQAPTGSTARFVRNVAHLFAPPGGRFLVYSTHWSFKEPFTQTLEDDGYTVTQSMHPGPLAQYDGVFVGGNSDVDREALTDYLAHGGHVYVATATADIEPDEKRFWNSFLFVFGLQVVDGPKIDDRMNVTTFEKVPLFEGVLGLLVRGPYSITMRPGHWSRTRIVSTEDRTGYWAISTIPAVPGAKR